MCVTGGTGADLDAEEGGGEQIAMFRSHRVGCAGGTGRGCCHDPG
jgi:hypothetical protein